MLAQPLRKLALFAVCLALVGGLTAASRSSHHAALRARVTLTLKPGNIRGRQSRRISVSTHGIATAARSLGGAFSGRWETVSRRRLRASEIASFRRALRGLRASDLKAPQAACHGVPIGDVGASVLSVGSHTTNCPPPAAAPLVSLLMRYLPAGN